MKSNLFSFFLLATLLVVLVHLTEQSSAYDYEPLKPLLRFRREKNIGLIPFPRVGKSYETDTAPNVRANLIPFMRVGRTQPQSLPTAFDFMLVAVPTADTTRWSNRFRQPPDTAGEKQPEN